MSFWGYDKGFYGKKELSEDEAIIKQIETNVVKECVERGFFIKKDEDGIWSKLYANLGNWIKNHIQDYDYEHIGEKCSFYTDKLLTKKWLKSKDVV